MYSIYLRGKVYVYLCTVQIGVRLSTWYVRYNNHIYYRGSGWYDQALSEAVLESIDFDYDSPQKTTTPWWCIVGGSAQLVRNMTDSLKVQPQYGQRVTRIDWNNHMDTSVYTNGSLKPTTYAAVFNSTTMGCLRMMNTLNVGFSYEVKEAMRALSYGPSAKVGVIFKPSSPTRPISRNVFSVILLTCTQLLLLMQIPCTKL